VAYITVICCNKSAASYAMQFNWSKTTTVVFCIIFHYRDYTTNNRRIEVHGVAKSYVDRPDYL